MTRASMALAVALCSTAAACGGSAKSTVFSPGWQNDEGRSIALLQARLKDVELPMGPGLAVGVVPSGLTAITLDGATKWSHAMKVDARPVIAGNVVVATGEGKIVALDARSGKSLWRLPSDGKSVRGAGDDGHTTVMTLANRHGGGSRFLAVNRSGQTVQKIDPEVDIGVPAILSGTAFVPWGNQYVSAIALGTGEEVARLLTRAQVSRAETIGNGLFFGDFSLIRFDEAIGKASLNQATLIQLPQRELPGKPRWFGSGTVVRPATASARDKIRLYARPAATGTQIESERFLATYFRIAAGLHSQDGTLRWVRSLPENVIGGDAAVGGFALCDAKGTVHLVSAPRGGRAGELSLGAKVSACVVDGGSFVVPEGQDERPLVEALSEAIQLREPDLVTIQRFLLRELSTKEEPSITKVLIDLVTSPQTPPVLLTDAETLLSSRRSGAEYMLEVLETQYDFLSGVLRPPPVGPLADALAAMDEKRAAPALAAHLNDPANDTDDIRRAAQALVKLASEEQSEDIRTFFSLYRATADDENMVAAVIAAAQTLVRIGGDSEKDMVRHAKVDPLTHPAVKEALKSL